MRKSETTLRCLCRAGVQCFLEDWVNFERVRGLDGDVVVISKKAVSNRKIYKFDNIVDDD